LSAIQSVVPTNIPPLTQTTWVPPGYWTSETEASAQLVITAEQEKWSLPGASMEGGLATPPDYDQHFTPLSNDPLVSEEWGKTTQPRTEVHSIGAWEGMNGDFEHTRLNSSACFSNGNNADINDGLDRDNGRSKSVEGWGGREWGEILKDFQEKVKRTDGGFREFAELDGSIFDLFYSSRQQ
jgi:hypothetical protein